MKVCDVQSNRVPEVAELLELYLETAKKYNFAHVAIAMCRYSAKDGEGDIGAADYVGDIALEKSQRENLQILLGKLNASIDNWTLPPSDPGLDASYVCYNVAVGPLGFDFLTWLIDAEMTRVREGAPAPLKVGFWMGKVARNTEDRLTWVNNVFRPLLKFIGAVEDSTAIYGRHKEFYVLRDVVAAAKAGERIPLLKAPRQLNTKGKSPVVITLRETDHWPERNSNHEEWVQFACQLKQRGEKIIFVRDTARAQEPLPGFNTYPAASVDLGERLALYECAKCNLFVSNGPSYVAQFGSRPWLQFLDIKPDGHPFSANTPSFWRNKMGVAVGEQFPWSAPNQRLVWAPDTYETIMSAWETHIEQSHEANVSMRLVS